MDSSKRAGRYAEEDEDEREAERVSDQEEDEYADEIVDLGDDVEPFSMEFNPYSSSLAQTNKKGNKLDFGLFKTEAADNDSDERLEEDLEEKEDMQNDDKDRESEEDRDIEQESFYDNTMYAKFSSSYKFSMSDLQELKRAGDETPETELSRPSRSDDDIDFEPIQDEEEEPVFMAPRLKDKELSGLSLLRNGLNGIDLRKPISVEKIRTVDSRSHIDVIQH